MLFRLEFILLFIVVVGVKCDLASVGSARYCLHKRAGFTLFQVPGFFTGG